MSHTPNELVEMFPDKVDKIHDLKISDSAFAKLVDDYHAINRTVHRGETDIEPMDDFRMEALRKERLQLLDAIAAKLN